MRIHTAFVTTALVLSLTAGSALASMHFTDVSGRERVITRGPATAQVQEARVVRPGPLAVITINAGPDIDNANNDYRRIQNAINAASPGDTIILSGTFDFTQPFAAAAWAKGNDGVAGNADDYAVLVPAGKSNITLTANSLGSATIQGPGDLAALDLEGFLLFDSSQSGASQGWTISNLRILDFDLSIGMFAAATTDYNNTHIQNNFIRIATDLNATVAPTDTNQNIGIHYSYGINQVISGNSFQVPGDGVSDTGAGNFSTTVVMQSTTSGGAVYDGLMITNNVIHVLNAQSANPQVTLGIWENGFASTSNITISGNSFLNDAAGNSPALNLEKAFRVTSHSGATTTVLYDNNTVSGANIGFQWVSGSNFSGNQAVKLTNNTVTSCDTGVLVQSNGIAHLETNSITGSGSGGGLHIVTGTIAGSGAVTDGVYRNFISGGSTDGIHFDATATAPAAGVTINQNDLSNNTGFGLNNLTGTNIVAITNYWGSNLAANVAAEVNGAVTFDPWLASGTDTSPLAGFQPFTYATTTTAGNLTTFAGTAAPDAGAMQPGNPVTLQMDGVTATVPLAQLISVAIQLGASDDFFTLGQTGVPTTFDGGTGNDTLIGTNVAQTWNITGAGSGNIPTATSSFTNTEALQGGTAADSFVFGAAGSVALTVDGGLGSDSLDNSAIPAHFVTPTGPGTLDGFKGTASGIGTTFDNINLIVNSPSDLAVTKNGPASATPGTVISYTITVSNSGPNPSINANLSDTLPAGTTFFSLTSPGGWSCTTPAVGAGGTVTCSQASFAVGMAVFTLNVNGPAAPAALSNTASVTQSNNDPTPGNNSSTANTTVALSADLSVVKTATATVQAGSNVTYNITLTNNGPTQATGVTLTDTLPANTTFVSATQNSGTPFVCTTPAVGSAGTISCTLASMVNATSATFTIVATVTPAAPAGMLSNTASVTATSTDPTPGNNSSIASSTITPANADLSITKTAGAGPYGTGGTLAYTITVSNAGPANAANTTVTDVLPAGTTFVSATPSQGSCSGTTTVTCTLGTLNNAATATITLSVTLPPVTGSVANTATVSSTNTDPTPANNTSTATVTVVPAAAIPTYSPLMLLMVGLALAAIGLSTRK